VWFLSHNYEGKQSVTQKEDFWKDYWRTWGALDPDAWDDDFHCRLRIKGEWNEDQFREIEEATRALIRGITDGTLTDHAQKNSACERIREAVVLIRHPGFRNTPLFNMTLSQFQTYLDERCEILEQLIVDLQRA
jgi:hypothetical protein